jgi:hypothetical protein
MESTEARSRWLPGAGGGGRAGSNYLIHMGCLGGVHENIWNEIEMVVAQYLQCTKNHWIVHFKTVNFLMWLSPEYIYFLNATVLFNLERTESEVFRSQNHLEIFWNLEASSPANFAQTFWCWSGTVCSGSLRLTTWVLKQWSPQKDTELRDEAEQDAGEGDISLKFI